MPQTFVPLPSHGSCLQAAWCLRSSKVQLQQLSKKATPKPFLLPRIPSLPTAQRKHPKHSVQGFMAVLLFLNQGGKDLEVFINKGCMKTRLFTHSAAQSGNCPCLMQSHGGCGCVGASLPAQGFCTAINQNKPPQNDPKPPPCEYNYKEAAAASGENLGESVAQQRDSESSSAHKVCWEY